MRLEAFKYLEDIRQAAELVAEFTRNKSLDDYAADIMLRSAVERQLQIVGEALREALRCEPSIHAHITDVADIISFRNRLVHGYATLADHIVWGIIEHDLPTLVLQVVALLEMYDEPGRQSDCE